MEEMVLTEVVGFPDPFAVATISGEQTRTTGVIKKTLNPYWNESFDMYVAARERGGRYRLMALQEGHGREHPRGPDIRPEEVQEEGSGLFGSRQRESW